VTLTEKGAAEADTMQADSRRTAVDLLAGLGAAEVSAFATTIDRMLGRLREDGPRTTRSLPRDQRPEASSGGCTAMSGTRPRSEAMNDAIRVRIPIEMREDLVSLGA
jgi:hypothetical protein